MARSVFGKTAQGALFLILLQISSRALTFIVNQILLRFLTPQILGVATQLELFSISTLYFARESIRVTIQRQTGEIARERDARLGTEDTSVNEGQRIGQRIQEGINLAWAATGLGLVLTFTFKYLYVRRADPAVLETPGIKASIDIYSFATILELLNEPNFAITQQQMLYGIRASSEIQATTTRCLTTCTTAIWAWRSGRNVGVLPFAIGQLAYAIVLNINYLYKTSRIGRQKALSRTPKAMGSKGSFITQPLLWTASSLYGQSLFKQLLTSGDQYLIATLTSLSSQGSYALASNYGGLLARVLFQPIEESSRALFARLLPITSTQKSVDEKGEIDLGAQQATNYLHRLLHAYLLLAIIALALGPPLSRPLLFFVAGPKWSTTEAPLVLASYCYYIPTLALNGLLEALVAAVATPVQIRNQSLWMVAFSLLFAVSGIIVLGWLEMGARGLVLANVITMSGRILWSWRFTSKELQSRGSRLSLRHVLPNSGSVAIGVATRAGFESLTISDGSLRDLLKAAIISAGCGLGILMFERHFLIECFRMLRTSPTPQNDDRKTQ